MDQKFFDIFPVKSIKTWEDQAQAAKNRSSRGGKTCHIRPIQISEFQNFHKPKISCFTNWLSLKLDFFGKKKRGFYQF